MILYQTFEQTLFAQCTNFLIFLINNIFLHLLTKAYQIATASNNTE